MRAVALLVESPLSLDEARRALIAATPERTPKVNLGQPALYGVVEGDAFSLHWDPPDSDDARGVVRVWLKAHGDRARVHVLLSREKDDSMSWPQAIAVYAVALGVVSWGSSWRDVAEALGFIAAAIALVALLLPIARLIVSRLPPYPFASSNLFVGHVKEFLSHALLAEPIEVKAKGQTGA